MVGLCLLKGLEHTVIVLNSHTVEKLLSILRGDSCKCLRTTVKTSGDGLAAGWQLFYRKIYVFLQCKVFSSPFGHWVHLESFRKQRSVHTV